MQTAELLRSVEGDAAPRFGECTLCGGTHLAPAFELADKAGKDVAIRQCMQCSVLVPGYVRHSDPTEATAWQVQLHEQQWEAEGEAEIARLVQDCATLVDSFSAQLGAPAPDRWICEIGAGRGGLLGALKARGYRVVGCEPSPLLCERARRFAALAEDELLLCSADALFDRIEADRWPVRVFFLWHVLEHLARPWDTMRRMAQLLKPGDLVIAQCPLLRTDWLYPEHYFFVTEPALVGLAESSGFEVSRLEYDHERAFVAFVFRRRHGPVPRRAWNGGSAPRVGAEHERVLAIDEIRRLRARIEADTRVLLDRERGLQAQALLLDERARRIESLEVERDRLARALAEQKKHAHVLEEQRLRLQAETELLRQVLITHARGERRSLRDEPLLAMFGLHASHRLYHRWKHLRALNPPVVAPTIRERLVAYVGLSLPAAVAARLTPEDLDHAVGLAAGALKSLAKQGGRLALAAAKKVRGR